MPKTPATAEVEFATEEGFDILKLILDAFNNCNLDKAGAQRLIGRGDEFQEGIKRLVTKLALPSSPS